MKHALKTAAMLAAALTMTGCAMNQQTGNYEITRTGIGLAAGTVAGGLIGAAMGDGSYAIKGAMIGAALGGGTGYYLDRKHAELRQSLAGTNMEVGMSTNHNGQQVLRVVAPSDVTFTSGSPDIQSGAYQGLTNLAKSISGQPYRLEITGHTDSVGNYDFNKRLSYQRAQSVGEFLYGQGIQPENMAIRGAAFSEPVASNDTQEGRARNRRVEINIIPI